MNTEFKVKPNLTNNGYSVIILVEDKTVSVTDFLAGEVVTNEKAQELVTKAKSNIIQAQALENKLNTMLGMN